MTGGPGVPVPGPLRVLGIVGIDLGHPGDRCWGNSRFREAGRKKLGNVGADQDEAHDERVRSELVGGKVSH